MHFKTEKYDCAQELGLYPNLVHLVIIVRLVKSSPYVTSDYMVSPSWVLL